MGRSAGLPIAGADEPCSHVQPRLMDAMCVFVATKEKGGTASAGAGSRCLRALVVRRESQKFDFCCRSRTPRLPLPKPFRNRRAVSAVPSEFRLRVDLVSTDFSSFRRVGGWGEKHE